jgi:transcriptional regulator with XRE-family HTH domain
MSRRAKVTPGDVGIPAGPNRRVRGLRRTEVAMLAGVSVEYYSKLERGAIAGASSSVLDAISRALRLDDTERTHLLDLARAADGVPASGRTRRRATKRSASRPSLALGPGRDHRRHRVRPQPAAGPARHERARPCLLRSRDRRRWPHPRLRGTRDHRGTRFDPHGLHGRTGIGLRRAPPVARLTGSGAGGDRGVAAQPPALTSAASRAVPAHQQTKPQSAIRSRPVHADDAPEARKTAGHTSSSICTIRPMGVWSSHSARAPATAGRCVIGVRV